VFRLCTIVRSSAIHATGAPQGSKQPRGCFDQSLPIGLTVFAHRHAPMILRCNEVTGQRPRRARSLRVPPASMPVPPINSSALISLANYWKSVSVGE
jgi:hypothetical protein